MEAIANGPLSQLFALMMVPLISALFLIGLLIFSYVRRRKKSKMKLGFHSSSSPEEIDASPADETDEEITEAEEINTDVLSPSPEPPVVPQPTNPPLTAEDKLDLGILSKTQESPTAEPAMQEKQEPFNLGASPPETTPMVTQTINSSEEHVELLRLLRDPQTGQLVVEITGQRYVKLADVTDKKIGQYILKVTAHLLAFTNGVIVTDAGMKSVYRPKLGQAPEAITASPPEPIAPAPPEKTSDVPTTPTQPAPPSSTDNSASPVNPSTPSPTTQQGGLLNRVAQPPPPPSSLTPLNLAEEIDEIVQARLRYSPLAANTFIKITSDFSGGIRINVNGTHYNSPDEIPDQQARELIQASIKEWEHS